MDESNRGAFGKAMTQLFAVYGATVTTPLLDAWWGVLVSYDLAEIQRAMTLHVSDIEAGMFRPTPAHVLKHLTETIPRERQWIAKSKIAQFRARFNNLDNERLRLMNDKALGLPYDAGRLEEVSAAVVAMLRDKEWQAAEKGIWHGRDYARVDFSDTEPKLLTNPDNYPQAYKGHGC